MGKPDGHGGSSGRWLRYQPSWHRKVASPTWLPKRPVDKWRRGNRVSSDKRMNSCG
ncbi:hypothetical protein AGRO_3383 [Agrobacterium sp. ATCC 31749]|nr:hypothetical protein AGRO_3383 [Agrobacterium sp. ATCC 31749]